MTEAEYNAAEGIRRSDLWRMEDSPEKFKWFLEHPVEKTAAMQFGSACHKWILEPKDWGNEYAIAPTVNRATKAGKEEWARFLEEHPDREPVSTADFVIMDEMADALMSHELANRVLYGDTQKEVPLFWKDPETGERCKAKLDVLKIEDGKYVIIDYKTTQHADTMHFNRTVWDMGYHFQAGFYAEGLMHAAKLDYIPKFVFIAQEKKAPYSVNVIEVSPEVMKAGIAKFHELLDRYHECKEVDIWPGYADDVPNETYVPGWAEAEMEDEE